MGRKLYVFVCHCLGRCSYAAFNQKLKELRALPLMHGVWAARSSLTAAQLKQELHKRLEETDRILVVEVSGDWASRRAENNLAELIPAARRSRPLPLGEAMRKGVISIAQLASMKRAASSL
jgi:hypothetical protein